MSREDVGQRVEPSKMTIAEFLRNEWLPLIAKKKPSTVRGYTDIVEQRLIPRLGDVRLPELTVGDIVRVYTDLLQSGRAVGNGGISERSLKHTHSVLHSALEYAVGAGFIGHNPARRLPRDARPKPQNVEMRTWSAEQVRVFLKSLKGDRLFGCFAIALMTGLRRSELLGLRWDDIDLEKRQLAVRRGRVAAGYEVHEGSPKSGRARVFALDDQTVAILRGWRKAQLEERLKWGQDYEDSEHVFTPENGSPIHPQAISAAFDRRVARAGLPRIRFHDCRHSHASLLF
jgi:integrase